MHAGTKAKAIHRWNMHGDNMIGLVPCGGHATRIAPLPCSKEILPVGLTRTSDGASRPKVVSHYLLENLWRGGVREAFLILRRGKWDIADYYGDGACAGMNLGYLVARLPYGPPFTLDQAYPFVRGARIAMGFPDILLEPQDAFARAFQRLETTRADLVLGLYRMRNTQTSDMIDVDPAGRVRELIIRPSQTPLTLGWMFAVWTPRFTEFLHEYLAVPRVAAQHSGIGLPAELTVGHVIQAAIRDGLDTQSVVFMEHDYLDIGTADGLRLTASDAWSRVLGRKADSSERSAVPSE